MTPSSSIQKIRELLANAKEFVDGYFISPGGYVISSDSNWRGYGQRILTQFLNEYGYAYVRVNINGKRKKVYIHKLVAANFCGDRPSPLHEIRHLDGVKTNNQDENLAWGTRKENAQDRERHGHGTGKANGKTSAWKLRKEYRNGRH